ncbi:MAG: HET-C-related protein [Burkholderiales bacterium]
MRLLAAAFGFIALFSGAVGADDAKPPPPPTTVPDPISARSVFICVECDQPFDLASHKEILAALVDNGYVGELRKALYTQDFGHQFQSKAHFDNCDFDGATQYIEELLKEVGTHVVAAENARSLGQQARVQSEIKQAFFALGQALHAVQDFYAHSNYVELMVPRATRVEDIERVAPWRPDGRQRIRKLREAGLVSGVWRWGFPKSCPEGTPSHGELAKDSEDTASGKREIAHLRDSTQYRIALFLAREDSLVLLREAYKQWPLLKQVGGPNVFLDVIIDRRTF